MFFLHTKAMFKKLVFATIAIISSLPALATASVSSMSLSSPVVAEMGQLPALYTCDGSSVSPPLLWKNAPVGTKYFALTMFTIPKDGPDHWYFSIWNIPAKTTRLPQGNLNIGSVGGNGENPNLGYAPPCSQGPSPKKYTFTLYALSRAANLGASSPIVSRDDLIAAVSKITLATANLDVLYTRPIGATSAP